METCLLTFLGSLQSQNKPNILVPARKCYVSLTVLRTKDLGDWTSESKKDDVAAWRFSLGTSKEFPWNSLARSAFSKIVCTQNSTANEQVWDGPLIP